MLPSRPRRSLRPERPRLHRRALIWYGCAALLGVVTLLVVQGALDRAARAEAAYGETTTVIVVTGPIAAGQAVDPTDVARETWPRALRPDGALDDLPPGRVALVALAPGEALLSSRLSGTEGSGPAALLAPDQRAVPVPMAVPGLPLEVGDSVDVLAGGAPGLGADGDLPGGSAAADLVTADATVLRPGEEVVVLGVARSDAAELAAALTAGPVVVALRPPGG